MVNNAVSQCRLRSDNDQLNTLFLGYFSQSFYVARADIQVSGDLSRTGIARRDVNIFNLGALGQLPDDGMLPGPTPNNQYLQSLLLNNNVLIYLTPCFLKSRGVNDVLVFLVPLWA